MGKTYETMFALGAKIDASFGKAFSRAEKQLRLTEKQAGSSSARIKAFSRTVAQPVIKARDLTGATVGKVRSGLLSLQGLATITLTVVGIDKLGSATLGSAMEFENQQISMEHWLKGNKKLAKEAVDWLDKFAAATPFEMDDLFPAMTRGIGITNGDIKMAERLTTLSADMAALTPGKTIGDAMEALADAQMGEFERLKEFNMKMTQEEYKSIGGFAGLLKKAEKDYAKGAAKLSKSAFGQLSTISDNISTYFRKAGEGILSSMMPRLQKITAWFDKHPKTVDRWKNELVKFGNQAGEYAFVRLERAFKYLQKNYIDNPAFKNLTFTGKVNMILDDISRQYQTWLDNGGAEKLENFGSKTGRLIGNGFIKVAPELFKTAGKMAIESFEAGLKSSPVGSMIVGGLGGAAIGSVVPGIGTGVGFGVGLIAGDITYHLTGEEKPPEIDPSKIPNTKVPSISSHKSLSELEIALKNNQNTNPIPAFSPQITIQGNADRQEIQKVLKFSYEEYKQYAKRYDADKKRLQFSPGR